MKRLIDSKDISTRKYANNAASNRAIDPNDIISTRKYANNYGDQSITKTVHEYERYY